MNNAVLTSLPASAFGMMVLIGPSGLAYIRCLGLGRTA